MTTALIIIACVLTAPYFLGYLYFLAMFSLHDPKNTLHYLFSCLKWPVWVLK